MDVRPSAIRRVVYGSLLVLRGLFGGRQLLTYRPEVSFGGSTAMVTLLMVPVNLNGTL